MSLSRRTLIGSSLAALTLTAARTWPTHPAHASAINFATASPGTSPVEVAPGLHIRPRSAWAGDLPPTGPLLAEQPVFLLVHHTATANDYQPDQVVSVMRGAYSFHTGPERGWPDVAYNFFIDRFGGVWEARAGSLAGPVMGDATGGSQGHAQLVCLIGNFTSVMPTPEALDSLHRTLAWLADRDGIATDPGSTVEIISRGSNIWPQGSTIVTPTIAGHRDMSATACPGDTFYPYVVNELTAQVDAVRRANRITEPESTPTTSTTSTTSTSTTSTTAVPSAADDAASALESTSTTDQPSVTPTSTMAPTRASTTVRPAAIPSSTSAPTTAPPTPPSTAPASGVASEPTSSPTTMPGIDGTTDVNRSLTAPFATGIAACTAVLAAGLTWRARRMTPTNAASSPPDHQD